MYANKFNNYFFTKKTKASLYEQDHTRKK